MHDSKDTPLNKELLQQRVEAKRDEIVNTVDEIRVTLTEQMRESKQALREATDWRHYVRKQPVVCAGAAVVAGAVIGKLVTSRIIEANRKPDWNERARETTRDYAHYTARKMQRAGRKLDEWSGRAQGESKLRARSSSLFASSKDLLLRELLKTAQHMIIPTVVAAITGKMSSDNKTTVVEKDVHHDPSTGRRTERTKDVRTYDDNGNRKS